jgi:hypothetical protein
LVRKHARGLFIAVALAAAVWLLHRARHHWLLAASWLALLGPEERMEASCISRRELQNFHRGFDFRRRLRSQRIR